MSQIQEKLGSRHAVAGFLILALTIGAISQAFGSSHSNSGNGQFSETSLARSGAIAGDHDAGRDVEERRMKSTRVRIDLRVKNVENAMEETRKLAQQNNGYITSSSLDRDESSSGDMSLKVPENRSTEVLEQLEQRYKVESRNTRSEDLTRQYEEQKLELENKRKELKRLEELMNTTESVESLVKIQERMSELRSRIQYLENSLEEVENQVEYTRIHVSFDEPEPISHEFKLRESLNQSYRGVFASLKLMIVGTGYLLPFVAIGLIIYKGRKAVRGFKSKE